MADIVSLTGGAVLVTASTTKTMAYDQAIDVSGYDKIDFQIALPGNAPSSVEVITSMNRDDADAFWSSAGTLGSFTSQSGDNFLSVPGTGKPLFRYIRWKVVAGANHAAVNIIGMGRRNG